MRYLAALVLGVLSSAAYSQDPALKLTEATFDAHRQDRGVVLLHVNWGREWNCHGHDSAQLQRLTFQRLPAGAGAREITLDIPSKLRAKDAFQRYALLVPPGEYALSGFRFKVATAVSSFTIYEPDASKLIDNGRPKAGSFRVGAGEIVYVGHFGVDCNGEPSPWRFYIEGEQQFRQYTENFHREFPFTSSVPVTYRLFDTEVFGRKYALSASAN